MTNAGQISRNTKSPATDEEIQFFDQLVESTPRSKIVKNVDYRFGEDSDGEPAVWITIITGPDDNPSKKKMAELHQTAKKLQEAVHNSDFNRWPYVRIMTE